MLYWHCSPNSFLIENERLVLIGKSSPVIRYSPNEESGAAAATGFIEQSLLHKNIIR